MASIILTGARAVNGWGISPHRTIVLAYAGCFAIVTGYLYVADLAVDPVPVLRLSDEPVDEPETEVFTPIEAAQRIVDGNRDGPTIEHRGTMAFYRESQDLVRISEPARLVNGESYYTTLFHELVHLTGHSTRLDRRLDGDPKPFGSPDYSKEEFVAEMGAEFLAAAAGIGAQTVERSAAYIDGWKRMLAGKMKLVVSAAATGQKAADLIQGSTIVPC